MGTEIAPASGLAVGERLVYSFQSIMEAVPYLSGLPRGPRNSRE